VLHFLKFFNFPNFYFIFYSLDSSFFSFFFVSFDFCTLLYVKRWRSTVFIGNLNKYSRILEQVNVLQFDGEKLSLSKLLLASECLECVYVLCLASRRERCRFVVLESQLFQLLFRDLRSSLKWGYTSFCIVN